MVGILSKYFRLIEISSGNWGLSKPLLSCHYLKSGQSAYTICVSQEIQWCKYLRVIAESMTGDQGAGNDNITNSLRTLIFPPLLETLQGEVLIR